MNKFFYFLAVLCLFTLGSCEKDVQPDIDAGGGTRNLTDLDSISQGDPRGGDGDTRQYCNFPSSYAFMLVPGEGVCGTTDNTTSLTCVIHPNYYPSLAEYDQPNTETDYDAFQYIDTSWEIYGGYGDVVIDEDIYSDEMTSSYNYTSSPHGYNYSIEISADFEHLPTGDIVRYSASFCISPDKDCEVVVTADNGGHGGITLVAYQPAMDTEEGTP